MGLQLTGGQSFDIHGRTIERTVNGYKNITTSTTTTIFTGPGILMRVNILQVDSDGSFEVQNTAGDTIIPASTTAFAGTYEFVEEMPAGCKIVTTNFTGTLRAGYFK